MFFRVRLIDELLQMFTFVDLSAQVLFDLYWKPFLRLFFSSRCMRPHEANKKIKWFLNFKHFILFTNLCLYCNWSIGFLEYTLSIAFCSIFLDMSGKKYVELTHEFQWCQIHCLNVKKKQNAWIFQIVSAKRCESVIWWFIWIVFHSRVQRALTSNYNGSIAICAITRWVIPRF